MHFQIEIYKKTFGISEIKMQQSVPMGQISEINMQQTFHVLQYTVARPVVENLKYWFRASLRR